MTAAFFRISFASLKALFSFRKRAIPAPTKKKIKRDVDALLHGRKDGKVVIKNVRPKTSGGTHEVIDEAFRDTASFKETKERNITE